MFCVVIVVYHDYEGLDVIQRIWVSTTYKGLQWNLFRFSSRCTFTVYTICVHSMCIRLSCYLSCYLFILVINGVSSCGKRRRPSACTYFTAKIVELLGLYPLPINIGGLKLFYPSIKYCKICNDSNTAQL